MNQAQLTNKRYLKKEQVVVLVYSLLADSSSFFVVGWAPHQKNEVELACKAK